MEQPDSFRPLFSAPDIFLILGVISISAAAVFTYTGKVWSIFMAGSTALENRERFGGTSHPIFSLVLVSSDTFCI
jgi:hypothetical protein